MDSPGNTAVVLPTTPARATVRARQFQVGSLQQSTPARLLNASTLSQAYIHEIKNNYAEQLRAHVDHVGVHEFLLLLLSVNTAHSDEKTLQGLLKAMVRMAVEQCNDTSIAEAVRIYASTAGSEVDLYAPWVKLANTILASLADATLASDLSPLPPDSSRLIFQRNDPKLIASPHTGSDSHLLCADTQRKPDVIGLDISSARTTRSLPGRVTTWDAEWKSHAKRYAPEKPGRAPLSFAAVNIAVEFKRTKAKFATVPMKYTTQLESVDWKIFPIHGVERQPEVIQAGLSIASGATTPRLLPVTDASEIKATTKLPPDVQIAIYAGERLSSCVAFDHALEAVVINDEMWLWWFDRGGAVVSAGFNLITDLPIFIVVLAILQRFNEHHWGLHPQFERCGESLKHLRFSKPLRGPSPNDKISIVVDVDHPRNLSLFGRATTIVEIASVNPQELMFLPENIRGAEMVAKISYPDRARRSEVDILCEAYRIAAREDKEGDLKHVHGHIPTLIGYLDDDRPWANALDLLEVDPESGNRRDRVLRVLLLLRLRPITELSGEEFGRAFRDCFMAHAILWKNHIHHRDISANNLMYRRTVNGEVAGILNDFDLAIIHNDARTLAKERTGTLPFMAMALLRAYGTDDNVPHIYEYDVESFGYVLRWITARYEEGKLKHHGHYAYWTRLPKNRDELRTLASGKAVDLCGHDCPISPSYTAIAEFIEKFTLALFTRISAAWAAHRMDNQSYSREISTKAMSKSSTTSRAFVTSVHLMGRQFHYILRGRIIAAVFERVGGSLAEMGGLGASPSK